MNRSCSSDTTCEVSRFTISGGVKGIGLVSPMKSKSKVTGKSDSPKSRWIPMSERLLNKPGDDIVFNPQPVCQYNPIMAKYQGRVMKAPGCGGGKEKPIDVIKKSTVVKESDKVLVVAAVVIEKLAVDEKDNPKVTNKVFKYKRKTELPKDNQKDNPKDKESDKVPVVAVVVSEKSAVDEKDNRKVTSKVSKVSDESDKATVVVPVLKEKPTGVIEKSTIIKESDKAQVVKESDKAPVAKDKPSVVGKGKVLTELPKKKHKADIPKDKPKPKDKHKVDSEVPVLRSKPEVKAKASVSEDVKRKRMLSKEDRTKKMKIKAEVKRKRKGGSDSDSDSIDEEKLRRVLKKLKKIKTEYSDEESGLKSNKKGKKKEKQLTPEEAAHEEYLREFPTLRASSFHNVSIDKIPSRLGRYALSKFSSTTYRLTFETGDYIEVTPSKIHDILGIPVGGILLFSLDVRPIEHEFVRSWVDQFYPKSLKEIRVGDIASKVISSQQVDFLFKVNFLTLFSNTMGRVAGLKGQICLDVVRRLREESVIFEIDWCGYIHSCHLKKPSQEGTDAEKESVDPTQEGTVVELNPAKECEIMSTPENYTQWLERNADLGDLFGDNSVRMEVSNQGSPTPDRIPARASNASASPGKRIVKPSSYLLSPYMNKKTKVVPKITRLEFSIGNSLFAMQGDKIENVFETHSGGFNVYGIRLNLETLAPGLEVGWIRRIQELDTAYWGFLGVGTTLDIFQNIILIPYLEYGVLSPLDTAFSNQVKAQFKGNEGGLALQGVDLVFFPICNHGHFYVVVFSLTSTTSMTILDNNVANYDTKYKEVCDLLLFVRHLKLYGHSRHGTIGRLKHIIPKLKWRTSENFHDCGVFTMLHMESFNGETSAIWDCGLSVESGLQCDMLRRLRFKFATKILLHKINVHSKKILELVNEFDKVDSLERMAIIVKAVKNREERDRI
ncbi:ulp1 protease family, C-terminal catalytic domain-containing protein [Tanacetum coccineum]